MTNNKNYIAFLNEMNQKHSFSIPLTKKYRVFSRLELLENDFVLRLYMENTVNEDTVRINSIDFFPAMSLCADEVEDTKKRLDWIHQREKQDIYLS